VDFARQMVDAMKQNEGFKQKLEAAKSEFKV
jgi:hypothetical protein